MITIQQYAQIIEAQLNINAHAKAFKFQFKVWADVGDYQNAFNNQKNYDLINCVLRETAGDYTPIREAKTKFTTFAFEIAVNQLDVDNIKVVLASWSQAQLGNIWSANDITYIVTPGAIVTGTAVNTCDLGSTVPLTMPIELQETEVGLITNEMNWSIATEDIEATDVEVLNGQIISQRTQDSHIYMNSGETVSVNQGTTLSIGLTIPVAKNDICKALFNAVIGNEKDEVYTITMSDGWSNGISDDFIMANGELVLESTKIVALRCTFLKKDARL